MFTTLKHQRCFTLSWPPTSHTVKLMFLYSTVSTLKPATSKLFKNTNAASKFFLQSDNRPYKTRARGFHTDSGNGGHDLSKLEFVKNSGLTSSIKTHLKYTNRPTTSTTLFLDTTSRAHYFAESTTCHQNSHLLLGEKLRKKLGESEPHIGTGKMPPKARPLQKAEVLKHQCHF